MKVGEDIQSGKLICGRSCLCDSCHTPERRVNPKFRNTGLVVSGGLVNFLVY